MAFELVAASRAEEAKTTPWRHAIRTGLALGGVGVFMAVVGILMMFQNRPIIVDTLTLGYATLGLMPLAAGLLVARRGLFGHRDPTVLGGVVAGALAAALPALLALLMSLVDLRSVFVALNPLLLAMLTFGQQPALLGAAYLLVLGGVVAGALAAALPALLALLMSLVDLRSVFVALNPLLLAMLIFGQQPALLGAAYLLVLGGVLGGAGALFLLLAEGIRRPLAGGLIATGLAGMLQELIRPILANSRVTKPLHDLLYTWSGLTLRGAVIIFMVAAIVVSLWQLNRRRIETAVGGLKPAKRHIRWGYMAAGALLVALFPMFAGNFIGQVLLSVGLFTLMGMGLNLEVGLAGLLDLGFVAFYAVGAYTTALLMADSPYALAHLSFWQAMPIAVLVSLIVGVIFGIPVLKIRGDYLAVATLALGEIVRVVVLSDAAAPLLAGAEGILQIPRPEIGSFVLGTPVSLFYLTLAASLVAAYVAWRLGESRLGRAWMAIRDDEDVAEALGINLIQVKLLAYGLGAAFAGLAGSIFAVMLGSIYPHSFQLIISINILALIIVGGLGSLPGVAVGALVLIGLPEMLREFGEFRYLFYGLAIIAVMRLKPEGLWPSAARLRELELDAATPAVQQARVAEKSA
jgi:branched-chain amino acid transport system permease protein